MWLTRLGQDQCTRPPFYNILSGKREAPVQVSMAVFGLATITLNLFLGGGAAVPQTLLVSSVVRCAMGDLVVHGTPDHQFNTTQ